MAKQRQLWGVLFWMAASYLFLALRPPKNILAAASSSDVVGGGGRRKHIRHHLTRTLQSWAIHHQAIPKTRSLNIINNKSNNNNVKESGSILSFQKPTKERLASWFGVAKEDDNDSDQLIRSMLQRRREEFNHESVGMTNPLLHIEQQQHNDPITIQQVVNTSPSSSFSLSPSSWWPEALSQFDPLDKEKWRILRYRRYVGKGKACYERVRDAALDWEFCSNDQSVGILVLPSRSEIRRRRRRQRRPSSSSSMVASDQPKLPHPYVPRGRYIVTPILKDDEEMEDPSSATVSCRAIGASRRLISFGAKRVFPGPSWLPKLFAMNPVMVVYDLVDQRGPATTFSSTAYATMKGHLIRGEERVTVAYRDSGNNDDDDNGAVEVEIVSISQPDGTIKAKAAWPFVGKMQSTFFERQMDHFERIGGGGGDGGGGGEHEHKDRSIDDVTATMPRPKSDLVILPFLNNNRHLHKKGQQQQQQSGSSSKHAVPNPLLGDF